MENTLLYKRKKRTLHFSKDEKLQLISRVKSSPRIWNVCDPLHSNKNAVDQAWEGIRISLGKPVEECKAAWVSLRESYRYRAKVANKFKSGSAGGEPLSEQSFSDAIDWEFAEEMSFLPNVSQNRRTFTAGDDSQDDNLEEVATTSQGSDSQYHYTPISKKRARLDSQPKTQQIWEKFGDILDKHNDVLKLREAESESPFKDAFSGFEFLLKQLPKNIADEACCSFVQTLLEKLMQEKAKSS